MKRQAGYPRIVFDSWNDMFFILAHENSLGRAIGPKTAIRFAKTGRYTFQEQGVRDGIVSKGELFTGKRVMEGVMEYVDDNSWKGGRR
jgi:hypothetical protein